MIDLTDRETVALVVAEAVHYGRTDLCDAGDYRVYGALVVPDAEDSGEAGDGKGRWGWDLCVARLGRVPGEEAEEEIAGTCATVAFGCAGDPLGALVTLVETARRLRTFILVEEGDPVACDDSEHWDGHFRR